MSVKIRRRASPPEKDRSMIAEMGFSPSLFFGIEGEWFKFELGTSAAWVQERKPNHYLIHWIESARKGDGKELMAAIVAWGDRQDLDGNLVCDPSRIGFYEQFGFRHIDNFEETAVMWRSCP